MKGIVLCGGYGMRLRPLTLIMNKHLLPVFDKPLVYYPLQTLKDLDITDVCMVLGGESPGSFVKILGAGEEFGFHLTYIYQPSAGGIAEAVGLCKGFVGNDSFIVILGDNLFLGSLKSFRKGFEDSGCDCGLVLAKVDAPSDYGVPEFDNGGRISRIIEKPKLPPSNYAVTGIYAYTPAIFKEIKKLNPSDRGELEISDAHTRILESGRGVYWEIFDGQWFDCGGSFEGLLNASVAAKRHAG